MLNIGEIKRWLLKYCDVLYYLYHLVITDSRQARAAGGSKRGARCGWVRAPSIQPTRSIVLRGRKGGDVGDEGAHFLLCGYFHLI